MSILKSGRLMQKERRQNSSRHGENYPDLGKLIPCPIKNLRAFMSHTSMRMRIRQGKVAHNGARRL